MQQMVVRRTALSMQHDSAMNQHDTTRTIEVMVHGTPCRRGIQRSEMWQLGRRRHLQRRWDKLIALHEGHPRDILGTSSGKLKTGRWDTWNAFGASLTKHSSTTSEGVPPIIVYKTSTCPICHKQRVSSATAAG